MTSEQALAFVLFAIVAAITPGPSNIILTSVGANLGVRRGLPTLLGVTLGMAVMLFVVAFGLGSLVLASPLVLNGLKVAGIGMLLWLAWKIATAPPGGHVVTAELIGFWPAAAFQWVSPKAWLTVASAVGTYLVAGGTSAFLQATMIGLLFFAAAFPSCAVWLVFGASVQRFLRTERASRIFNVAMGLLLAASIVILVR